MNKAQLVEDMARRSGLTRVDCGLALNAALDSLSEALSRRESVLLMRFGTFELKRRAPRLGRDLAHGGTVTVPGSVTVVFRPGSALRAAISEKE